MKIKVAYGKQKHGPGGWEEHRPTHHKNGIRQANHSLEQQGYGGYSTSENAAGSRLPICVCDTDWGACWLPASIDYHGKRLRSGWRRA